MLLLVRLSSVRCRVTPWEPLGQYSHLRYQVCTSSLPPSCHPRRGWPLWRFWAPSSVNALCFSSTYSLPRRLTGAWSFIGCPSSIRVSALHALIRLRKDPVHRSAYFPSSIMCSRVFAPGLECLFTPLGGTAWMTWLCSPWEDAR